LSYRLIIKGTCISMRYGIIRMQFASLAFHTANRYSPGDGHPYSWHGWHGSLASRFNLAGRSYLARFLYQAANLPGLIRHAGTYDKNNTATLYDKWHEPHRAEFLGQKVFTIVLDIRQQF
jgi:hypothetical protein